MSSNQNLLKNPGKIEKANYTFFCTALKNSNQPSIFPHSNFHFRKCMTYFASVILWRRKYLLRGIHPKLVCHGTEVGSKRVCHVAGPIVRDSRAWRARMATARTSRIKIWDFYRHEASCRAKKSSLWGEKIITVVLQMHYPKPKLSAAELQPF